MYANNFLNHASAESNLELIWGRVHGIIIILHLIHGYL